MRWKIVPVEGLFEKPMIGKHSERRFAPVEGLFEKPTIGKQSE